MDKYEKVTKIGEGSFGKAILVKSKVEGKQYVIKEIGISRMSGKERQESRKEVAVLANMSHPNIVKYKESFEEGGCLYIVMDYCEGGDLFKRINAQKGVLFPEDQILDWFVQICLALKHVHDRKILHRDIKSQNIFLAQDGTIQLGDFGIARVLNSTVELARTCIGTPYYLSPEICENKPYNNKSDIWALGCVLYEMCTLKHAFEAGNMKNLVVKIIRGSYPPVSVHYSHDLRSLVAQLFKRSPKDRPSVNAILEKPFLSRRIPRFLSPQLIAQEFSHVTIHKQPKVSVAHGVPAKRPAPGSSLAAPAQKITKPAAKYGVPLTVKKPADAGRKCVDAARKCADRKPVVKHKPAALPVPQRKVSRVEEERKKFEEGMRKKRLELMEKERKQREQMLMLKAGHMKRFEREKLNRINRAREQGWRHVLSSSGGSPEKKFFGGGGGMAAVLAPAVERAPHELVAKLHPRGVAIAGGDSPSRAERAAPGPVLNNGSALLPDNVVLKRELHRLDVITKQACVSRQRGHAAAERARQVEEFWQRKREAMLNKVRAEGQLGALQKLAAVYGSRPSSAGGGRAKRNTEEEEYLSRLRQIRLQNFNERQQIKARLRGEKYDSDGSDSQESSEEAEQRRKKIEELKAQAKARAALIKEQLEKKRREAYEKEKKAWEDHLVARGVKMVMEAGQGTASRPGSSHPDPPAQIPAQPRPNTPAISMSAALKDVGAEATVPQKREMEAPNGDTSLLQDEKRDILRRLNQSFAGREEEELSAPPQEEQHHSPVPGQPAEEARAPSDGDRRRWEAGSPAPISIAEQILEDTSVPGAEATLPLGDEVSAVDRKKWEAGDLLIAVAQQTLEETCIGTAEKTVGEVIHLEVEKEEVPRKAWGHSPDSEVLKVLEEAELQTLTLMAEGASVHQDECVTESLDHMGGASFPKEQEVGPTAVDHSSEVKGCEEQESSSSVEEPALMPQPALPESNGEADAEDVETEVLEECQHQALDPPSRVVQAWEQRPLKAQEPSRPAGGSVQPEGAAEEGDLLEMQHQQPESTGPECACEEPLFYKLLSPARRRTAALAILSAQSSQDDSVTSRSRSRSASPVRSKAKDSLLIGLSTGLFDANNPKRESRELFHTGHEHIVILMQMDTRQAFNAGHHHILLMVQRDTRQIFSTGHHIQLPVQRDTRQMLRTCSLPDLGKIFRTFDEDISGSNGVAAPEDNLELEDIEAMKVEEHSECEEDVASEEGDEDLQELRASMERLLQEQPSEDYSEEDEAGFTSSPPEEEAGESQAPISNGLGAEDDAHSSESELNEEWHSDYSGEGEESDTDHQDSIFSRLEELRFKLEQDMGFECFIEAYNKIKAIHEDEDENIELGSSLLQSVLGREHQHLYPKILHLVMADGAYQEDNDE
ncbi:serine/threonine-protein kinase Nek1 isoform X4 [Scleropages formosus]|uniref:serine/threonine-protein kinase Nek1 isoform X4 n=1 Tax=Scleropages formosus TaxID=113540 RepID=UPI000878B2BF|nr:serine/threonine-protein kinase Nek1 isoform X4 [Scleropages formosus]